MNSEYYNKILQSFKIYQISIFSNKKNLVDFRAGDLPVLSEKNALECAGDETRGILNWCSTARATFTRLQPDFVYLKTSGVHPNIFKIERNPYRVQPYRTFRRSRIILK